jgi:hypothetical protein
MQSMNRCGTVLLSAALLATAGCTNWNPQRIDNLSAADCRAQVEQGIVTLLVGQDETPQVAQKLAAGAVDQMSQIVVGAPRPGSRLAADLRVLTTDAKVASSSGNIYDIVAEKGPHGCRLRLTQNGPLPNDPRQDLPACACEPSQE